MKSIFFLGIFMFLSEAHSADFTGAVYAKGSNKNTLLYKYFRHEEETNGVFKADAKFSEPGGKDAAIEQMIIENNKIKSYTMTQPRVQESGKIEVVGDKIRFSFTKNGKTKIDEEDFVTNFIVGPTILPYLKSHWNEILAGKEVDVRLAVLDRVETVGFKFTKVGESESGGKKVVRVKMNPTSFVIAALVDPIFFTVDKADGRTIETEGTVLLREKINGKVDNLSATTVFD